jgi:hypothetical protein
MVFETLVSTKLNHLTRLITRENSIILTHRESIKSYRILICNCCSKIFELNHVFVIMYTNLQTPVVIFVTSIIKLHIDLLRIPL